MWARGRPLTRSPPPRSNPRRAALRPGETSSERRSTLEPVRHRNRPSAMKLRLTGSAILAAWLIAAGGSAHAQVTAGPGSVASGRDIIGSPITIINNDNSGVPGAVVDAIVRDRTRLQEENIALLREKLELTTGQVRVALEIVGEANVPPER